MPHPLQWRVKAIVIAVIIAPAYLAQQNSTGNRLDLKIMIHILLDVDALAGGQTDLCSGWHGIGAAIRMDRDISLVVDGLVRFGVIDPDQHIAAAPADDIPGPEPVEMHGRILAFLQVQNLFGIDLGIFVGHVSVAVADGIGSFFGQNGDTGIGDSAAQIHSVQ